MNRYRFRHFLNGLTKGRLINIYSKFSEFVSDEIFGRNITFNINTVIGEKLFFYGTFEENEINLCKQYIKSDSVVLDIGANIGVHTICFAKMAPDGLVFSIEPSQDTYCTLLRNISDLGNVIPLNLAASASTEVTDFYVATDNAYSSLKDTKRKAIVKTQKIISCRLDKIFYDLNLPRLDFVKIDVEGLEQKVIEGLVWVLDFYKPIIFCEIYGGENSNINPNETVRFIIDRGYDAYIAKDGELVKYLDHDDNLYNYFFVPVRK